MSEVKFIARDPHKCYHYPDCNRCKSYRNDPKRWEKFPTEEAARDSLPGRIMCYYCNKRRERGEAPY